MSAEEKEFNHNLQRVPPNVASQGSLNRHGSSRGHTLRPVVIGIPKVGPSSISKGVGSKPKDEEVPFISANGFDPMGISKG